MAFAGAPPESIKVWFHRPFAKLIVMYIVEGLLAELILLVQWFGNARHTGISDGFTYLTLAVSLLTGVRCFGGLLMMYLLARADRECGDRLFRTSCFWYGPFRFFPLISLTLVSLYLTGAVGVVLFRQVELDQMDFSACSYFLSSYLLLAVNTLMVMFHLFFFQASFVCWLSITLDDDEECQIVRLERSCRKGLLTLCHLPGGSSRNRQLHTAALRPRLPPELHRAVVEEKRQLPVALQRVRIAATRRSWQTLEQEHPRAEYWYLTRYLHGSSGRRRGDFKQRRVVVSCMKQDEGANVRGP